MTHRTMSSTPLSVHRTPARVASTVVCALALAWAVPNAHAAEPESRAPRSGDATDPSLFQRVSSAVERGVKAAASGVERGASAAAGGIERGASAAASGVETGVNATRRAAGTVARKVGLPQGASAPEASPGTASRPAPAASR